VGQSARRTILFLGLITTGCQSRATAPAAPDAVPAPPVVSASPAPPALPPIDPAALVDTFEFYVPRFPETRQLGSFAYRRMVGRGGEDLLYMFSWGADEDQHFVVADISGDAFLVQDRTWGHANERFYRIDDGVLWMKRFMRVGEGFTSTNVMRIFSEADCTHVKDAVLYLVARLTDHRYEDVGGDLGLVEVIEFSVLEESYLYAKDRAGGGLGLVAWKDSPGRGGQWIYHNRWSTVAPPVPRGCP
jgi:hypothetical protein